MNFDLVLRDLRLADRMRTHVEVDPKVGLRGLEGVKALIDRYRWANFVSNRVRGDGR